jgi:hypothetical protein
MVREPGDWRGHLTLAGLAPERHPRFTQIVEQVVKRDVSARSSLKVSGCDRGSPATEPALNCCG